MYDEDGKDELGNFMGITAQQSRDAGINSTDNLWSATLKVEQLKSDELRSRLGQGGAYSPIAVSHDASRGSGTFKLLFFSLLSFGAIAYVAWHAFSFLLGVFVYSESINVNQAEVSKRTLFILGVLLVASFFVWFKSVKFFRRAFITKR